MSRVLPGDTDAQAAEDRPAESGSALPDPARAVRRVADPKQTARRRRGLLYLRNGCWKDEQVIPASWVQASTTAHSVVSEDTGYGYL